MRSFPVALGPDPAADAVEAAVLHDAGTDLRELVEAFRRRGLLRDGTVVLTIMIGAGRARSYDIVLSHGPAKPDRKSS